MSKIMVPVTVSIDRDGKIVKTGFVEKEISEEETEQTQKEGEKT
jgi:hypothetical protein